VAQRLTNKNQQPGVDISESLRRILAKVDRNHDQLISDLEIDEAVLDGSIMDIDAFWVAFLKEYFKTIKKSQRKFWFLPSRGLKLDEISTYCSKHLGQDFEPNVHIERRDAFVHDEQPIKDIKPEAVEQGTVGNCYFMATLASVAKTNPQIIQRILHMNEDGTYTITFPGARDEPITVPRPTDVELILYAQATRYGIWAPIIEKAYGKYLSNHNVGKSRISAENTGNATERVHHAMDLLTGQTGQWKNIPSADYEELVEILDDATTQKRILVAVTDGRGDHHKNSQGIPELHAYSVIDWDKKKEVITLRNPWGTRQLGEPHSADGEALDGKNDGIFSMSLHQFRQTFAVLFYEEWTPDENYIDAGHAPPRAVVTYLKRK
jgi:hypothetical protein